MGANNWRVCPKCRKNEIKNQEVLKKQAKDSYGKVSEDRYIELKNRAEFTSELDVENLREDWEIGISVDGEFFFSYNCSCDVCGFSFFQELTKKVKL